MTGDAGWRGRAAACDTRWPAPPSSRSTPSASRWPAGCRLGGGAAGRRLRRPELARRASSCSLPAGHEREDAGSTSSPALPAPFRRCYTSPRISTGPSWARWRGARRPVAPTARREPGGWSWNTVGPAATRNLAGYAHGASGFAVRCSSWPGRRAGRFRFAAEMALLYERRLFDAERRNWPDLRHGDLNRFFREAARRCARPTPRADRALQPAYMTAWCHGAPGIGLARLRAWELTGDPVPRRGRSALVTTLRRSRPGDGNFSLCHGVAGNCELPWLAAELFEEDGADRLPPRRRVRATAVRGRRPSVALRHRRGLRPEPVAGRGGDRPFLPAPGRPGCRPCSYRGRRPRPSRRTTATRSSPAGGRRRGSAPRGGFTARCAAAAGAPPRPAAAAGSELSPVETAYGGRWREWRAARGSRRRLLDDAFRVDGDASSSSRRPTT